MSIFDRIIIYAPIEYRTALALPFILVSTMNVALPLAVTLIAKPVRLLSLMKYGEPVASTLALVRWVIFVFVLLIVSCLYIVDD